MITQVNCSWINKVDGGTALTQGPSEKLLELFPVEKVSDSQLTNPEFGPFILFLEEIVHWCLCSMVSEYFFIGVGISSHTSLITGYSELGNGRMKGGCPNEQKPASVKKWSLVKGEPWVEISDDGPASLVEVRDQSLISGVCKGSAGPMLTDSPLHVKWTLYYHVYEKFKDMLIVLHSPWSLVYHQDTLAF